MTRALPLLLGLIVAAPAVAQEGQRGSRRLGSFEMSLSGYRPNIDSEFGGGATLPFNAAFGGKRNLLFRVDGAYSLFVNYGSLDVGLGVGYWEKSGRGQLPDGTPYVLATRYSIPFMPYARVSLDRYQWWVLNGSGGTANAGGRAGSGATNGYSFGGGLAFLLNFIDPTLARDMDRNTGINQTYIFVDVTKSFISDFGSAGSWSLSDDRITIAGGLLFVF
jgi:hypothetical protein